MLIWSISYPVCLPLRWKREEINIGLSHHLLVRRSEVQHPAEDFDYFPVLWQTHCSLRSLSLLSFTFFSVLFPPLFSLFCSIFLPLLFLLFQSHLELFDSPALAHCDLSSHRCRPHEPHTSVVNSSTFRSEVLLTSVWVCICVWQL